MPGPTSTLSRASQFSSSKATLRGVSWWAWLLVSAAVLLVLWAGFVLWLYAAGRRTDARALATFKRVPGGERH